MVACKFENFTLQMSKICECHSKKVKTHSNRVIHTIKKSDILIAYDCFYSQVITFLNVSCYGKTYTILKELNVTL